LVEEIGGGGAPILINYIKLIILKEEVGEEEVKMEKVNPLNQEQIFFSFIMEVVEMRCYSS
jgi:hypothetical protein